MISMCSNRKRGSRGRKSRSKAKKPKFLSLRSQFPANEIKRGGGGVRGNASPEAATSSDQLNLLPPNMESQVLDRESHDHENIELLFSAGDSGATTLTGLLDASVATASISSHNNNISSRLDDPSPSAASLTYAYRRQEIKDRAALVRNALRSRERDSSEEKWVCYSEVVERKVKEEEVTSSAVVIQTAGDRAGIRRLSLKLDYEEILSAWSDKGSLYIDAESSQIVPDMNDDFLSVNGVSWEGHSSVGVWTVPEMVGESENGEMRMRSGEEELKIMMGQRREASVLRYKEKRHNRLFSKKIRYQVRKLNAEKRPRFKGRFVKRS